MPSLCPKRLYICANLLGKDCHLSWVHRYQKGMRNTRKGRDNNVQTRKSHARTRRWSSFFSGVRAAERLLWSLTPKEGEQLLDFIWWPLGINASFLNRKNEMMRNYVPTFAHTYIMGLMRYMHLEDCAHISVQEHVGMCVGHRRREVVWRQEADCVRKIIQR